MVFAGRNNLVEGINNDGFRDQNVIFIHRYSRDPSICVTPNETSRSCA
jgi:hypothetical protein